MCPCCQGCLSWELPRPYKLMCLMKRDALAQYSHQSLKGNELEKHQRTAFNSYCDGFIAETPYLFTHCSLVNIASVFFICSKKIPAYSIKKKHSSSARSFTAVNQTIYCQRFLTKWAAVSLLSEVFPHIFG